MSANEIEKFEMLVVARTEIHGAPYNPRTISESARKKLLVYLKRHGLLQPIIVNRTTMNLVAGHQRLEAMDKIIRKPDYSLTVAMVELDEREEVEVNVLLNNQSVMGEWDTGKLAEIKLAIPGIDFLADLGFDQVDLEVLFSDADDFAAIAPMFSDSEDRAEDRDELAKAREADRFKAAKKQQRQNIKWQESDGGDTWAVGKDDYTVTFVFETNREKHEFMSRLHKPIKEKCLRGSVLFDIASGKYNMKDPISFEEGQR